MTDNALPAIDENTRIAVIGLGYVGLPLAVALARHFDCVGLDIDESRIAELREGHDRTNEVDGEALRESALELTADPADCAGADVYIVTVPTPVDADNRPDLDPVLAATRTVAKLLSPGRCAIVCYESTVYPGVTEDVCGPELAAASGLEHGPHFRLGYSPERINPGDREHSIDRIVKVVAGESADVREALMAVYGKVTAAGCFPAASIRAAEAAKVIENAQRDINVAFMNEITQIFARMDISIWDVLEAANTKWNFLDFKPGLVGGHCIGVDPFYLAHAAQAAGHDPKIVLSGRAVNDAMGAWTTDAMLDALAMESGRVLVMGLTFKRDVPDLRNSRVLDVVTRLRSRGFDVTLHDPLADTGEAERIYSTAPDADALSGRYDLVLCAVDHADYRAMDADAIAAMVDEGGAVADLKGIWRDRDFGDVRYWTL
ncbi:nucleotide sugar dehydrogenase [uncultured Parasphingopyxis sp.]|uniref:nucleotide sugar dehydrogenase n=2 Tax=Parasphingopyxis TaxID=1234545 RepID=UPI0026377A17|nr:nucleotide sugar dehydrogenase [uncultured Parasphingopyxis sp.]